jgi:hypothetical protein
MKLTEHLRHQLMMRPYTPFIVRTFENLPSLPDVWDRATKMFGEVMARVGSPTALSKKRLKQADRFELMLWLRPMEELVRSWLISRAVTWLLMTNAGRKLMYPKICALRQRPRIIFPHPGWYTIAAHRAFGPEPAPEPKTFEPRDRFDTQNWRCRFQALPMSEKSARRKRAIEVEAEEPATAHTRTDISTARRIEMIARVMARPDAAIRRIARQIVRLPAKALKAREHYFKSARLWMHGEQEFYDARIHEKSAIRAFYRTLETG